MESVIESMRLVQDDCRTDAERVDATAFSPRGVGEAFGTTLAMLCAVARAVETLAERVERA